MPMINEAQADITKSLLRSPEVAAHSPPLRIYYGRHAGKYLELRSNVRVLVGGKLQLITWESKCLEGPGILVMGDQDLHGPDRGALLETAKVALPGRPIVIGGSDDRLTVLAAINEWHAFRLLPSTAPAEAIVAAIQRAYEMLQLEVSVELYARHLLDICRRLSATLDELHVTQARLLHAERLAAVGTTIGTLTAHMHEQSQRLEAFRCAALEAANADGNSSDTVSRISGLLTHLHEAQGSFDALLVDMLTLAGFRSAEIELELLDLDALVTRTVRLFQYDPLGRERQIYVDCRSKATVRADANRLRHALLNLLRNAAQATTSSDHIRVRLRRFQSVALIEVEDTGIGMTPETLEQVFTPFFTTKGASGMGLGLRLARAAIEVHGGTLDCTSVAGQGATFHIRLPVVI